MKLTKFFKIGNIEAEILTVKVGAFLLTEMVYTIKYYLAKKKRKERILS